jgi:hypothetical protein
MSAPGLLNNCYGLRWADRPCTAISLLALLLGAPTIKAQAVNPMDALQFYVGRWSCPERKASDLRIAIANGSAANG